MSVQKELGTIAVISIGFLMLFFVFKNEYLLVISGGIAFSGFLFSKIRKLIVKYWLWLGRILGFVNSRILLSLIFFLLLTPLALLKRLFSQDKFYIKRKKGKQSYFRDRNHTFTKEDFEQLW